MNPSYDPRRVRSLDPSRADVRVAEETITHWEGYEPTSLAQLQGLAAYCGVSEVYLKLEQDRFGTDSFKALGPPYALQSAMARSEDPIRVAVAATSGNHGRALAWGARRLGVECVIVMPSHTSVGREEAIRALGATVIRVDGTFDDALENAQRIGGQPGHCLVADLEGGDGSAVARDTIAGYSVLAGELVTALPGHQPTHVFVAAGNGSLAAATCHRFCMESDAPPRIISVEPLASDAVRRSIASGELAVVDEGASVMDGLVTCEPSRVAWPILRCGLTASLAIPDSWAISVLRRMAAGSWGDSALEMGETGVAAIAGLIDAATQPQFRSELGINGDSRLVAIVCEGVTDRDVFERLVGSQASKAGD